MNYKRQETFYLVSKNLIYEKVILMENFSFYENNILKNTISSMITKNRVANSLLVYGEKGLGKKTAADYISAALLCEKGNGVPCGECKSCKMVLHKTHPDVIYAVPSGKSGNYKIDTLRDIVENAPIMPNEGKYKIYIIADMDNTLVPAQNALLKLIEEPPDHCVIILTAQSRSSLLPTIISRVVSLSVHEVSSSSCEKSLAQYGYKSDDIKKSVEILGGNIGKCKSYLDGESIVDAITITKSITDAINSSDEYLILKEFSKLIGDKPMTLLVLGLLCEVIRDAMSFNAGCNENILISTYKDGAVKLSEHITKTKARKIYLVITKYIERINSNGNLSLAINSLCSEIKEVL